MERRILILEKEILILRDTISKLQVHTEYNSKFGDKLKRFIYLATDILPLTPLSNMDERYYLKTAMVDMGNIVDSEQLEMFLKNIKIMSVDISYSIEFRTILTQLRATIYDTIDFDNIPGNFY